MVGGGIRGAVPCGDGALLVREAALEAIGIGPAALWVEETTSPLRAAAVLRASTLIALLTDEGYVSLLTLGANNSNLFNRPRLVSRLRVLLPPPFREPHLLASWPGGNVLAIGSYSSVALSALNAEGTQLSEAHVIASLPPGALVWDVALSASLVAVLTSGPGPLPASTLLLGALNPNASGNNAAALQGVPCCSSLLLAH